MASELEVGKLTVSDGPQLQRVSQYTAQLSCVDSGGNQTLQILGNRASGSGSSGTDVLIGGQQSRTTGNVLRVDQGSDTYLTIDSSGKALFSGSKVTVNTDGTIDWGNAADAGRLTWDTNDAKIRGVANKNLKLGANNTDYVTIDTNGLATFSGAVAFGGTSGDDTSDVNTSGSMEMRRASGSSRTHLTFVNGGTTVGSIKSSTTATNFNTSSDYRLKENLEPLTNALDRLDQLPVYRFNFTADPDTTVDGFVAHEVSAHVPEAVTGEKDAMKTVVVQEAVEAVEAQPATYWEEGDELPEGVAVGDEKTAAVEAVEAVAEVTEEQPDYQGIDQSKLVPLLVAAVKELKAKVEALEGGE